MTQEQFKLIHEDLKKKDLTHFSLVRISNDFVGFSMHFEKNNHEDLENMLISLLKQGTEEQQKQIKHILLTALLQDGLEELQLLLSAEKNKREGKIS